MEKNMEVKRDECGEISEIIINDTSLTTDDGETWHLPKDLIGGILVKDLPEDVGFEPCKICEDNFIQLDFIPMRIQKLSDNKVRVVFEDSGTRKYWDGQVGFMPYMKAKRDVVKERENELGDIKFENYEDDGAWIWLSYSAEIEADDLFTIIQLAEQIAEEIEGAAEITLGGEIFPIETVSDEKHFTLHIVLPILRKLGFTNVRYNHGKKEYGKDIVFARITEFFELEHWGAQVKFGDISGGAGSEIDSIIAQADDAFKMPFYDVYARQKAKISKLTIIISGKFTENAIEKICEKIESSALKNNLIFIDGEKLANLIEKLRK